MEDLVLLEARHQVVGARLDDVGAEDARGAVDLPGVEVEQRAEVLRGLEQELEAQSAGLVAAQRVVLAGELVVDPVAARLDQAGEPRRDGVGELAAESSLDVDGVEGAVRGAHVRLAHGAGLDGVELDDAGRRVATEQRALRSAQDLDALDVEERHALEDRVLEHDLVVHHRHRL